jgi:hypothetical protein
MNLKIKYLSIVLGCVSILSCAQSNEDIIPKAYVANKTSEAITIDGEANEDSWKKTKWSANFIDIQGVKTPKYQTNVKMLWDEEYFYILAKIEEPHVWGDIKKHDAVIFHNNDFEVFIDPDGDTHNYYELEINALNTVWDLFITKPYREVNNIVLNDWHITGLKSAVSIEGTINNASDIDKGWTLEIAIPWSVYKTSYYQDNVPRDQFWRVNFSRVNWEHDITDGKYSRKKDENDKFLHEYNWVWSPQGVINMHEPEKWGYVYFSLNEVGNETEFDIPRDEEIKWELYKLYRAQKKHFTEHQQWLTSIESLKLSPIVLYGETLEPSIENHSSGWTITVKSPFSNKTLSIKEDGKFTIK